MPTDGEGNGDSTDGEEISPPSFFFKAEQRLKLSIVLEPKVFVGVFEENLSGRTVCHKSFEFREISKPRLGSVLIKKELQLLLVHGIFLVGSYFFFAAALICSAMLIPLAGAEGSAFFVAASLAAFIPPTSLASATVAPVFDMNTIG